MSFLTSSSVFVSADADFICLVATHTFVPVGWQLVLELPIPTFALQVQLPGWFIKLTLVQFISHTLKTTRSLWPLKKSSAFAQNPRPWNAQNADIQSNNIPSSFFIEFQLNFLFSYSISFHPYNIFFLFLFLSQLHILSIHSKLHFYLNLILDQRMCEQEEYFEMNFCKMNAVPFGVATINRESLPWQLIVADSHRGRSSPFLNLSTNPSF